MFANHHPLSLGMQVIIDNYLCTKIVGCNIKLKPWYKRIFTKTKWEKTSDMIDHPVFTIKDPFTGEHKVICHITVFNHLKTL
jgi:hypothetical protein